MPSDVHQAIVELLPRLRRFALALTGSRDAADDLVQTACLKALSRLHQFEVGTRLDSWLFRIMHTTWIDFGRSAIRRHTDDDEEALQRMPVDARIHERAEARDELATVRRELSSMPEEQRSVVALIAVEGLSYQEAADLLGVPVGTVVSRLSRARKRLSDVLGRTRPGGRKEQRS